MERTRIPNSLRKGEGQRMRSVLNSFLSDVERLPPNDFRYIEYKTSVRANVFGISHIVDTERTANIKLDVQSSLIVVDRHRDAYLLGEPVGLSKEMFYVYRYATDTQLLQTSWRIKPDHWLEVVGGSNPADSEYLEAGSDVFHGALLEIAKTLDEALRYQQFIPDTTTWLN